jgi:N-acetylglucosaminyldiphosphoundecaprenol N-acetyl-beta-D-mannosaminyltransferase
VPLVVLTHFDHWKASRTDAKLQITTRQGVDSITLCLSGRAVEPDLAGVIAHSRAALAARKPRLIVDLSSVNAVDARFLGLLLMLRKRVGECQAARLEVVSASAALKRIFHLNEVGFLPASSGDVSC